jgi:hypothetical protein
MSKFARTAVVLCALGIAASAVPSANAAIVNSADVNGLTTFQDLNTGRVWLDLNNFFGQTTNQMVATANAAGFTFATEADVHQLLDTLPLTGGEWPTYAAIMGQAPNRDLIWGSYDDGGDPYGWAFSFNGDTVWTFVNNTVGGNDVPNSGTDFADMNIWAFQTGVVPAPEPSTLAILAAGLLGLAAASRRGNRRA